MTHTQAPQHRSAEGALVGNRVILSSVGQLPFEKLGDHLEILRSDDPTYLNWYTSAQGLVFMYELPLIGSIDDVLHQMFATVPKELAKGLRRLIEFDWRYMVKSPDRLAQNPELRRLLIPYIWRHGGAEELTQFEACLKHQPKQNRSLSPIRRDDKPVAPPPILDETNQLLIAILLDHKLTASQQRLMILSEDPLIQGHASRYYQHRRHETHLILGGCVGNDQAVKQALAEFLLAQDPLAIPHLIACVHQPYMRKLILAELAPKAAIRACWDYFSTSCARVRPPKFARLRRM